MKNVKPLELTSKDSEKEPKLPKKRKAADNNSPKSIKPSKTDPNPQNFSNPKRKSMQNPNEAKSKISIFQNNEKLTSVSDPELKLSNSPSNPNNLTFNLAANFEENQIPRSSPRLSAKKLNLFITKPVRNLSSKLNLADASSSNPKFNQDINLSPFEPENINNVIRRPINLAVRPTDTDILDRHYPQRTGTTSILGFPDSLTNEFERKVKSALSRISK